MTRFKRSISLVVSIGLFGLPAALVAGAGTASAAPDATLVTTSGSGSTAPAPDAPDANAPTAAYTTRAVIKIQKRVIHGKNVRTLAQAVFKSGGTKYAASGGSSTLQRRNAGSSTWTTVATASGATIDFIEKARIKGKYRFAYSGGSSNGNTYSASSDTKSLKTMRNLHDKGVKKGKALFLKGDVTPKYKRKAVSLDRKINGKWKRVQRQKTTKRSEFKFRIYNVKVGSKFRMTIKGSKKFAMTKSTTYTVVRTY